MTRALPLEQREKIVSAYENNLGSVNDIATIFDVTTRSVYRYLKLYRDTGDLTPQKIPGRNPILTSTNLCIIKLIVLSDIDGTLADYRDRFNDETGIEVTIVTIHNACKTLRLNRKKSHFMRLNKKETISK